MESTISCFLCKVNAICVHHYELPVEFPSKVHIAISEAWASEAWAGKFYSSVSKLDHAGC